MTDLRRVRLAVAAGALALVAACSSGGGPTASPSSSPSTPSSSVSSSESATAPTHVAQIGVVLSETGPLKQTSTGFRQSVELAIREANADARVEGWRFDAVPANDSSNQSGGQQAASGLAANPRVIGVVGSLRSTTDEGMQPILNSAGIAQVAPAATTASLTRRLDGTTTVRPYPTYFRLAPTDVDQGVAGARYAKSELEAKRVAIVTDGSSYGRLIATSFGAEASRLGLRKPVVRTLVVTAQTSAATATTRRATVAESVRKAKVGVVFFGGSSTAAAAFAEALRTEGVTAPLMGGDTLLDGRYLDDVGALAAAGDLAVFPGAPADAMTSAQGFLRRYRAAGFGVDPGPYGATAYDATRAIIDAFGASVGSATKVDDDVRAGVVSELGSLRFEGATGPVSFDRFGDARERPLTIYAVVGRGWADSAVVRVR